MLSPRATMLVSVSSPIPEKIFFMLLLTFYNLIVNPNGAQLPRELVLKIFEILQKDEDNCTSICLGLVCKAYYSMLKAFSPEPIDLFTLLTVKHSCKAYCDLCVVPVEKDRRKDIAHHYTAASLLETWMGSRYRLSNDLMLPPFLIRKIYGDEAGEEQTLLKQRYADYDLLFITDPGAKGELERSWHHVTPNPFGMGQDWYEAAIARISRKVVAKNRNPSTPLGYEELEGHYFWRERFKYSNLRAWMAKRGLHDGTFPSYTKFFSELQEARERKTRDRKAHERKVKVIELMEE